MMTPKYQYEWLGNFGATSIEDEIDSYGEEGWRLVSFWVELDAKDEGDDTDKYRYNAIMEKVVYDE